LFPNLETKLFACKGSDYIGGILVLGELMQPGLAYTFDAIFQ
jgi:hypothetical protein